MIDEIDYFPKRDKYKTRKKIGSGWNELKKQKSIQDTKEKSIRKDPKEEEKKK
jgi:hypothetical protein